MGLTTLSSKAKKKRIRDYFISYSTVPMTAILLHYCYNYEYYDIMSDQNIIHIQRWLYSLPQCLYLMIKIVLLNRLFAICHTLS